MELLREAFIVRLKPGALEEWKRRHEDIWPELARAEHEAGVVWMSIFADDPLLFVYSEVQRPDSWERLVADPVHKRWVDFTSDLSESARPDSTVDRRGLPEVFHRVYMPEVLAERDVS